MALSENSGSHRYDLTAQGKTLSLGAVATLDAPLVLGNERAESVSTTTPAVATSGTIDTAGVGVARVTPAAAVTGVILAAGTRNGQTVRVLNNGLAASTITFAAAATSNVANGVTTVIAGLTQREFVWDAVAARWFAD